MLKARIIPCLDVKDGRVVKGVNFVNLRDAGDPVEQATIYDRAGADELCFLDITASHERRDILLDVVGRTADVCFMPLTVGGGVRSLEDIRRLLLAGADKVSIMTAAVKDPELVRRAAEKFGSQCIVVAVDAKLAEDGTFRVFTHGGREPTGLDAVDWADPRRGRRGLGSGHRLGRGRYPRPPGGRCAPGPCRRPPGRLDLSFRHLLHRRGQGPPSGPRRSRSPARAGRRSVTGRRDRAAQSCYLKVSVRPI